MQESLGRRVSPATPDESLVLLKPTMGIEHEGGMRFGHDSVLYQQVRRWIASGMLYDHPDDPALQKVTVYPRRRLYRPGASQPLLVEAHYDDGSVADVTHLAVFESRDKGLATVDEHGRVRVGERFGETVIMARFLGLIDTAYITLPTELEIPAATYESLPVNNPIDALVYARLQELGLLPSELCTDHEFLRRAYLDALGVLPTAQEARSFLDDPAPDKRNKLIDQLLADRRYADYWAVKWGDMIRPNQVLIGVKSVYVLDQWIRDSLRQNKPYDQMVRQIITAEGHTARNGAAIVFRDRPGSADIAELISRVFLGVRIQCAKCHHHPNEKWSQADFYQLAAFFSQVKQYGGRDELSQKGGYVYHTGTGEVKHPVTDQVLAPAALKSSPAQVAPGADPRQALADWMAAPDNPFFAPAAVNRLWGELLGRGIVEPVDDFRASNPPSNQPLLDYLARDFIDHGFDLKHTIRRIMQSRIYQLSSNANQYNARDEQFYSRFYRRRLPAEVMLDAVCHVTGTQSELDGLAPGCRAVETWNNRIGSPMMDAFGRPVPLDNPPCERNDDPSLVQSLHLMNSTQLQARIADEKGRAAALTNDENRTLEDIAKELYLTAYGRYPIQQELTQIDRILAGSPLATRRSAVEDVMWAILNSPEFVFNH